MAVAAQKFSQTEYAVMIQSLLPPGDAFPRSQDTSIFSILLGLAKEDERVDHGISDLVSNAFPSLMDTYLLDWERVLGLPDDIQEVPTSTEDRKELVRQRLVQIREFLVLFGANRSFFGNVANMLGQIKQTFTVVSATANTIEISSPEADDFFNNMLIIVVSGTGKEEQAWVKDWDTGTNILTLDRDLETILDVTSIIDIPLIKIFDSTAAVGVALCGTALSGLAACGGVETLFEWAVQARTNGATLDGIIQGMFNKFKPVTTELDISFTL